MQIRSSQQDGSTKLNQELVIHFPEGIPAFEDAQNFTLAGNEEMEPFVNDCRFPNCTFGKS